MSYSRLLSFSSSILVSILLVSAGLLAQSQPSQLKVTILDPDSRPVAGARIDLYSAGSSQII